MKFPIIFAHRGANSYAPENSLSAFEKAIQLGCDGIELDVRMCATGEIIVFHDRYATRMTCIRGNVQKMAFSQLRQLNLIQKNYPLDKIPTLSEVLDLARKKVLINIDVKKASLSGDVFEQKIVKILEKFGLSDNIIISSFNPFVLKKISLMKPKLHVGFIFRNRSSIMMLNGHPVKSLHARHHILSQKYINHLSHRCTSIYSWTVDDEAAMHKQIQMGVDGIITNRPEVFFNLKNKLIGNV